VSRKRTTLFCLMLAITILALPPASAGANTIRYAFRWYPGGRQMVSSPTTTRHAVATYAHYRIQSGDTLFGISRRLGTTVAELQRLNRLADTRIVGGRLLLVPFFVRPAMQPVTPALPRPAWQPAVQPAPPQTAPQPTLPPAAGLTQAEQQMLDLVNRERTSHGLSLLQADPELTRLARLKSQDMITLNYFAHNSPTYGSPFDMMRAAGVVYRTAGENLARAASGERAHTALMNSSGHRANILSPNFTHIGIGIITDARLGMTFTQLFVGR